MSSSARLRPGMPLAPDTVSADQQAPPGRTHADLAARFRAVRGATEQLSLPLSAEDCVVQSMDDASPTKWHLAHTTWFFDVFVLEASASGYRPFRPEYRVLFNSYYNTVGDQYPRPRRGMLSRPPLEEVWEYRRAVDREILRTLEERELDRTALDVVELGLHHEQQHQELILTDAKHMLSCNPLRPAYRKTVESPHRSVAPVRWHAFDEGLRWIGHDTGDFSFDNEVPSHRVLLHAFEIASRLATNDEYLAFVEDGGYERPELWLSDGWIAREREGWTAPLYWQRGETGWSVLTLGGPRALRGDEPVCHVSYYEADAFARWSDARLPSEKEWEVAAAASPVEGNFVENDWLHPCPAADDDGSDRPVQLFGDVWEWTRSPYGPYPGYAPTKGALGEYNGKFMCNQMVLRGGSCATSELHARRSYRNFFPPEARWQFSGLRLARDAI